MLSFSIQKGLMGPTFDFPLSILLSAFFSEFEKCSKVVEFYSFLKKIAAIAANPLLGSMEK